MEEETCYGVVAEVEIFEMDELFGFAYRLEKIHKLVMARCKEMHRVAICRRYATAAKVMCHKRVGGNAVITTVVTFNSVGARSYCHVMISSQGLH